MSYKSALFAAGAKVLTYESFGSYQGDWLAKVEYNGEIGWVAGSYGSCSHCDAFEAEFGYSYEDEGDDYQRRLALFGVSYLEGIVPQEQQEAILERQLPEGDEYDWGDFREQYAFVVANR